MNDAQLAAIESAYGLEAPRCVERVGGRVVRVAAGDRELAVKLFAPDELELAEREAALLAHLAASDGAHPSPAQRDPGPAQRDPGAAQPAPSPGYRVQALVRTRGGELLARLAFGAALVTRWERGTPKPFDAISAAEWHALGRALAALHERLASYPGPLPSLGARIDARDLDAERHALDRERDLADASDPGDRLELARYLDAQRAVLEAHGPRAARRPHVAEQPVHDDFNQFNFLFDESNTLLSRESGPAARPPLVLDWEGAMRAPPEYEVVRCMNHLPILAPERAASFVEGYRAARPLRAQVLRWAVSAALCEHALKRWPVELWRRGEPGAEARLVSVMHMMRALAEGADALEAFFVPFGGSA